MTKTSVKYVRASARRWPYITLIPELTEVEHRIVKRGRNTSSQVPKNAKASDYRYATGLRPCSATFISAAMLPALKH